jgi:hypothetical protein
VSRDPPVDCDQFNDDVRQVFPVVVAVFASLRTGRSGVATERDQWRSGTAAPAEQHAVTPAPKARRFAATSRPQCPCRTVAGGFLNRCEGTHTSRFQEDKMATTQATTTQKPNETITYAMLVIFTVDANSDEHLQDQQAIRDEAESWIASLDATVHGVSVRKAD